MTTQPATPEGRLLREAREHAGLTMQQAADAIGMSLKQWGAAERGTTEGREFRPPDRTLADMGRILGIAPDQLTAIGRPEAAAMLRDITPGSAVPADFAGDDDLIESLIAAAEPHHRKVLSYLWTGVTPEGDPKPRAQRVADVLGWVSREMQPGNGSGEQSSAV